MERTTYLNQTCIRLANDSLELLLTQSVGPRIISLRLHEGQNLFAELPDLTIPVGRRGVYHLRGGHRLWHAPELPRRTYQPDDSWVMTRAVEGGVKITQPVEAETHIQKMITVTLPDQSATVLVDHSLKNVGLWPIELSPWAITQLRTGGTAILPQTDAPSDRDGVLPNRQLAIWPYTDLGSPHVTWGKTIIWLNAAFSAAEGAFKIGFPNPHGWLAYYIDRTLFVKHAPFDASATYEDIGSSSECYTNEHCIELETLGPRTLLQPGQSVSHQERWTVIADVDLPADEAELHQLMGQ